MSSLEQILLSCKKFTDLCREGMLTDQDKEEFIFDFGRLVQKLNLDHIETRSLFNGCFRSGNFTNLTKRLDELAIENNIYNAVSETPDDSDDD